MAITPISKFFINADKFCDNVPLLSTASNLINLFQKCVLSCIPNRIILKSHYYAYLTQKSFSRCFLLLIPLVGKFLISRWETRELIERRNVLQDSHQEVEERLKNVTLDLIEHTPEAFFSMDEEIQSDRSFLIEAAKRNPEVLQFVKPEFLKDKEFFFELIPFKLLALKYASPELLGSEEFMTQAIEINSFSLGYGASPIKDNEKFVLQAVKKCGSVIQFASQRLRREHRIIVEALKSSPIAFHCLDPDIQHLYEYTAQQVLRESRGK